MGVTGGSSTPESRASRARDLAKFIREGGLVLEAGELTDVFDLTAGERLSLVFCAWGPLTRERPLVSVESVGAARDCLVLHMEQGVPVRAPSGSKRGADR